jgi:hypothetical protein
LKGVENAIVHGLPIEEPIGGERRDPSLEVTSVEPVPPEPGSETPAATRLSGRALPNTVISLFIYSYLPIVVTTTTDADGNWTYDLSSAMAEGEHLAYVSINDDTGKLVANSNPLSFFVKTARAVSEEEFLRGDVNVGSSTETYTLWFIAGGAAVVLLAIILTVAIVRQANKKEPLEPPPTAV